MTETEINSLELTIRMVGAEERQALERLAERDSARAPAGSVVGAFAGGELLAAASIESSEVVADPFSPTAEVRSLLASRVAQLRGTSGRSGGHFALAPRPARG